MGEEQSRPPILRFGVFELDLRTQELRREGLLIKLPPQPFKVLALLVSRPGDLVTRPEFREQIWGDTFVDFENSLNACIKQIRTALGDDAETPRFIETLPRLGYRFLVPVQPVGGAPAPASAPAATTQPASAREPALEFKASVSITPRVRPTLSWVITVVVATALLAGVAYLLWDRFSWGLGKPQGKIMLVVLPFDNLSADPEQEYFSDGLTEEMITQLGRLNPDRLGVIARTSAMHYKNSDKSMEGIARELQVDYILEGSVRREADRVRISAQLIQVRDRTHLWAESYERELPDVLAIQSEVSRRIADSLALELLPAQQAALARPAAVNPEAYQAYLKGRYHWNRRTPEALQKSIQFFQEAIARDPQFALAYAGLADAYGVLGATPYDLLPPREAKPKAEAAARQALEIDDTLAEAHTALAHGKLFYDYDWKGAEREFQRALELNPGYATARQWYAEYLWVTGRSTEALAEIQRALERDPYSLITHLTRARHYYLMRQYPQAVARFRDALEMDPNSFLAHFELGLTYVQMVRFQEGIAEIEQATKLFPDSPLCLAGLANAYALAGRTPEARQVLNDLHSLGRRRHVPALYLAGVYAGLGEKDRAFEWLEKAYVEHSSYLIYLNLEPSFDSLRSDPRFHELLRRLNLPARG